MVAVTKPGKLELTCDPSYTSFSPASSPPTIQRQWLDYNPTMSVTAPKVLCNGGTSAALVANITAGDKITAKWAKWTHKQVSIMVWMYKCAADIKSCDGSGKKWLKIDQMRMTAPPLTGTSWGTAVVYKNFAWTSTIPASLAPGYFLIRHELLHSIKQMHHNFMRNAHN
jgi:hypothetical protein